MASADEPRGPAMGTDLTQPRFASLELGAPDQLADEIQRNSVRAGLFGSQETTRLGRYRLLGQLGQGSMGVVYLAEDDDLGRRVALKVLRESGDDATKRFLREARSMASLAHPNIATVHEVIRVDGRVCIALEYVQGKTLHRWLQTERTLPQVLEMFTQAGHGLAAAHDGGIVHRDFKPDNVLVGDDGRARVLDFGLAKPTGSNSLAEREKLTATGAVMGTPRYMAPEQFKAERCTPATDQFSFCIALYEAVCGERPFAGDGLSSLGREVLSGRIKPFPASVPEALRSVVSKGLSVDPDERFANMHALLAQLGTVGRVDPGRGDDRAHGRRSHSVWWLVGVATITVVISVAIFLASP